MWKQMRFGGLILTFVGLLIVSFLPAGTNATSFAQAPAGEAWPARRAGNWLDGAAHRPAEQSTQDSSALTTVAAIPTWSRMVFQSLRDGNWEIYLDDGTGQVRLTNELPSDVYPRLNPGCTKVVFASNRTGNYQIYAMNLDGSGLTRLTFNDYNDVNPSWSPDGTHIAFESDRTGDGDIYVMNADGSGAQHLTYASEWEGEPTWSSDGRQIAFTSYRNSVYRIWRMDADGSDQVQLSSQPYSERPSWSPTGEIAFDADGNNDGWQELWTMNSDGSGQAERYDPPEAFTDARVGSWSPDGRSLVFFRVTWVYYQGNWFWTTSYLDAWDSATGAIVRLSSQGEDMLPDWQSADLAAPSSSVLPLPSESPSPFTVTWNGQDEGLAGLASFDVQVRDGLDSPWTDWLPATTETSGDYPGVGGHTYYFRCRARDNAGNVEEWPPEPEASTTVEAIAPSTAVAQLVPYSRGEISVRWAGTDRGGSGIATYDVQVRDGTAGAWTDWQTGVEWTEAPFTGTAGHTYYFRARGRDWAQNVEPWPPGDGDTHTTLYVWAITGTLRDNRETPVMGAEVSLVPQGFVTMPSNFDGAYAGYEANTSPSYAATWPKAGYGELPATSFNSESDAQLDLTLPPLNNLVLNGGFETGSLEPEWMVQGTIPAASATTHHSGAYAAAFGSEQPLFTDKVNLSDNADSSLEPQIVVDGSGRVHVVWYDYTYNAYGAEVLYRIREPDGTWSDVENVSRDPESTDFHPQLAVDGSGAAHVIWWHGDLLYYARRPPDGTWSDPVLVGPTTYDPYRPPRLAVEAAGNAHAVWSLNGEIMYALRPSGGSWTSPQNISHTSGSSDKPYLALDGNGNATVVWDDDSPGYVQVFAATRSADGSWSSPQNISNSASWSAHPRVQADASGIVHAVWLEGGTDRQYVFYSQRAIDGSWSDPVLVSECLIVCDIPHLAAEASGVVHVAWSVQHGMSYSDMDIVAYARRDASGRWSDPEVVSEGIPSEAGLGMAVTAEGAVHLTWGSGWAGATGLFYALRGIDGHWSPPVDLLEGLVDWGMYSWLAVDQDGRAHAVWMGSQPHGSDIFYAESVLGSQAGDATILQPILVTEGMQAPTLGFWYQLLGLPGGWSRLDVRIDDGVNETPVFSTTRTTTGWTYRWIDLTPWHGREVTLRLSLRQASSHPYAWALVDEVSAGPAYPDVWAKATAAKRFLPPGEPVAFSLTFGNRGGTGASGAVVTDTLPVELQFVSADPPPTTITPYLTWVLGDLPAGSEGTITLVTAARPGTPANVTLTNTVEIASTTEELENLNDEAEAQVWIGWRLMLPVVARKY